jgi:hypothetical protein
VGGNTNGTQWNALGSDYSEWLEIFGLATFPIQLLPIERVA